MSEFNDSFDNFDWKQFQQGHDYFPVDGLPQEVGDYYVTAPGQPEGPVPILRIFETKVQGIEQRAKFMKFLNRDVEEGETIKMTQPILTQLDIHLPAVPHCKWVEQIEMISNIEGLENIPVTLEGDVSVADAIINRIYYKIPTFKPPTFN